jgi:uncharacterized Tic20 family protein
MSETPNPDQHAGAEQPPYQPQYEPQYEPQFQAQYQPPAYQPAPQAYTGEPTQNDRNWASAAHWGTIVAAWLAMGFLAPLIIMLTVGNQSPFVRKHAVESLNFQISLLIYGGAAVLFTVLTLGVGLLVVLPIAGIALVAALVFLIQASIRAAHGQDYRYPLTLRFVS